MKITTNLKIGIPIVSLLLAFGILAFQHYENNTAATSIKEKNSSIQETHSLKGSMESNSINDSL